MALYTDTIVRLRAPKVTSAHGATRRDWTNPERLTIERTLIQSATTNEAEQRPEVTHTLWAALTADIDAEDRIAWTDPRGRARTYEVDGEPKWFRGPSPLTSHIEAALRAVDV